MCTDALHFSVFSFVKLSPSLLTQTLAPPSTLGSPLELNEFIALTLSEIQKGVHAAINDTIKNGVNGAINPVWGTTKDIGASHIQNVNFDIAVTVVEKVAGSVGGGIKVVGVNLGGGGSGASETTEVSRVQFSIPIVPPVTTVT